MESEESTKQKKGSYYKKTKQEKVDEKVERLFESYKLIDEMQKRKEEIGMTKEGEVKKLT